MARGRGCPGTQGEVLWRCCAAAGSSSLDLGLLPTNLAAPFSPLRGL